MKNLIIILSVLFLAQVSLAEELPEYMKDGTITVTLKDGKTYTFSTNEYKVVKRGAVAKKTEQIVEQKSQPSQESKSSDEGSYRITLHGGVGFNGLRTEESGNKVDVSEKKTAVFGLSLSKKVTDKVSVGGTLLNNDTYLLGIGLDFK